jgi:hypothetical protein
MSFRYYGGKIQLAHRYPPPAYRTIVEPFAGGAAYAGHWATLRHRVILVERDPAVVKLWREAQTITPGRLDEIEREMVSTGLATHPFMAVLAGGSSLVGTLGGGERVVTERMAAGWSAVRRRLLSQRPLVRRWTVIEGDYTEAPDVEATWFIDPPYRPARRGVSGDLYRVGAETIDYEALGEWCRSRRGQVIVCEQAGADWLPFRPFAQRRAFVTRGAAPSIRTEVIWTRTPGRALGSTPFAARARAAAEARRRTTP